MLKQWTPQPQEPVCGAFPQETPKYFRYLSGKRLKQVSLLPAELGAADSWAVQYRIHVLTLPLDYFFFLLVWFSCSDISVWGWSCVRGGGMERVFPSRRHCSRFLSRSFTAVVLQLECCSWIAVSWQCRLQRKAFYFIFLCNAALDLKSVFAMIEKCLLGSQNLCGNI